MDVENDTLTVHPYVLLVARSNKQLPNCVVRIVAHVETFGDATFGRATRWREDSRPAGTLWLVPCATTDLHGSPPGSFAGGTKFGFKVN